MKVYMPLKQRKQTISWVAIKNQLKLKMKENTCVNSLQRSFLYNIGITYRVTMIYECIVKSLYL